MGHCNVPNHAIEDHLIQMLDIVVNLRQWHFFFYIIYKSLYFIIISQIFLVIISREIQSKPVFLSIINFPIWIPEYKVSFPHIIIQVESYSSNRLYCTER